MTRHTAQELMIRAKQQRLLAAQRAELTVIEAAVTAGNAGALAKLQN